MNMKLKFALWFAAVDALAYWVLFHSGVVLPWINPSPEAYAHQMTSFPRNAAQIYLWILVNWPTSMIVGRALGDRYLVVAIAQAGLLGFVIGALIDRRRASGTAKGMR